MITRLFPNREETINGRFNLQLGRALHTYCDVEVIAPVPSFPPRRQVPLYEHFDKISVLHPRYFAVPWLNRVIAGRSLLGALKHYRLNADVLLASFAWPDGFAVVRMGQALRIPVIVQVLGSDIDLLPKSGLRRIETIFALHNCQQIYAVSGSLRDRIISLGISPKKITVIHNGVDPALFHPRDRAASRRELGLPEDGRVVLYVGWINQDKGVKYLLEAVASMDTKPILVLAGPDLLKGQMQKYARSLGIAQQCRFAGSQPHEMIGRWMGAADVFALPSLHEGCPNVILEALASGVSVVTTNVGGIPELLSMLNMPWCDMVPPRNVPALAAALERALRAHWTQKEIQVSCSRTWDDVAREVHQLFIKTASFPQ
jgi:glycosyltransferase involved in cell wall biosynthesis